MTLQLASEVEYKILNKYKKSHPVDECDRHYIARLSSVGMIRYGVHVKNNFRETAKLTNLGKQRLQKEKIFRNPIKTFLSGLIGIFS